MPSHHAAGLTVLHRGAVLGYATSPGAAVPDAVAFRDGQIVAVGTEDELAVLTKQATSVVDLDGRLVIPGFIDAHAHPLSGGVAMLRCDLSGGTSIEDYRRIIASYAAVPSNGDWITGRGFVEAHFGPGGPTAALLDEIVTDRPVALRSRNYHSMWVNSVALRLAGIASDHPEPVNGHIVRDRDGKPTGHLYGAAAFLMNRVIPVESESTFDAALQTAQSHFHSLGIVAWHDATINSGSPEHYTYLRAQQRGQLTARVTAAFRWDESWSRSGIEAAIERLVDARALAPSADDRFSTPTVKIFQDGVAESRTAGVLEPYVDPCGQPTDTVGYSMQSPDELADVVTALDRAGFQAHFHAVGDRGVREVLDAVQTARARNGVSDLRHQIAHLFLVDPTDVARFAQLDMAAVVQPLWAAYAPGQDPGDSPLGRARFDRQFPIRDMIRSGAVVAMGSDWPVSSPDPLQGMHVAVNRTAPGAPVGGAALGPQQAISFEQALAAYTRGSAWATHTDTRSGVLAVGMGADIVVLDENPLGRPNTEIADSRVTQTYARGRLVYEA